MDFIPRRRSDFRQKVVEESYAAREQASLLPSCEQQANGQSVPSLDIENHQGPSRPLPDIAPLPRRRKRLTTTKPHEHGERQSTLNLNDNMKALPSWKTSNIGPRRHRRANITSTSHDRTPVKKTNSYQHPTISEHISEEQGDPLAHELEEMQPESSYISLEKQPLTRPISHDQLVIEVKGIYAGLVILEAKAIEVDEVQLTPLRSASTLEPQSKKVETYPKLSADKYRSLIALHKQLLHEHHDFFLASQHPAASPAVRSLAEKYDMTGRMWRHGIDSFLNTLRKSGPGHMDSMLEFIDYADTIISAFMPSYPEMQDQWISIRTSLNKYRKNIADLKEEVELEQEVTLPAWPDVYPCDSAPLIRYDLSEFGNGTDFFNFHQQTLFAETLKGPEFNTSSTTDFSRASYIYDVMAGWCVSGYECLGDIKSFNIYAKVFMALASAAQNLQLPQLPKLRFL